MKICIIGLPGSGKTTLAKKLAHMHSLEHMNLDYILWRRIEGKKKRQKIPEKEYLPAIEKFISKDNWIVEGIFAFENVLKNADKIIWINPPLQKLLFRQWKRYATDPVQRREHTLRSNMKLSRDIIKLYFQNSGRHLRENLKLISLKELERILSLY